MADIIKLDILSDGSISLDGTRITPNKMYGIQDVIKSVNVSKKSIVEALDIGKEIRNKVIDEFSEKLKWEYDNSIGISKKEIYFAKAVIEQVTEQMKGGAE